MRDPAGILQRVPELAALAGREAGAGGLPAELTHAIAGGDPHEVFSALRRAVPTLPPGETLVAEALLANRALFTRPVAHAPTAAQFAGFGTALHGREEHDPQTGAYVLTQSLTVLYLPVFPLAQHVVTDEAHGVRRFYGVVPNSPRVDLWRGVAGCGAALLVLLTVMSGLDAGWRAPVDVLNPLDVPVFVVVDAHRAEVAPGGRATVQLETGGREYVVSLAAGEVIERGRIEVPTGSDTLVLNILGGAPVARREVVYTADGAEPPAASEFGCGRTFLAWSDVDYRFARAPEAVEASLGGDRRVEVDLQEGGWRTCVGWLLSQRDARTAARVARLAAAASPDRVDGIELAYAVVAEGEGGSSNVDWLRPLADRFPLDVRIQRVFASALLDADQRPEARERYAALEAQHPENADAIYLRARVESDVEARRTLLQRGLAIEPDHAGLLRTLGWDRLAATDWSAGADALARSVAADPTEAERLLELRVAALAAAGRSSEAVALLLAGEGGIQSRPERLRLYVAVARKLPEPERPVSLDTAWQYARALADLGGGEADARVISLRLSLGDDIPETALLLLGEGPERSALAALRRLGDEPERVRELLAGQPVDDPTVLHPVQWILLRGEAMRAGDTTLQVRMDRSTPLGSAAARTVRAWIAGEVVPLDDLPPEQVAAVFLARSRQPGVTRSRASDLRKYARLHDPLHALVTVASLRWP